MSAWSEQHDKQWIADAAQQAHVPSFPLREPAELLASPQLAHRRFYRVAKIDGRDVTAPGPPFGLTLCAQPGDTAGCERRAPGPLPLSGVRVLDFSWVIAGPTTTRYLAAMGAEVIKVEAPGRGDPGRASELHTVLGQAKRGIVLDLKRPEAVAVARALAAKCDVLVENFATGVMDRLGLGAEALRAVNPGLVFVSASGLGRTGPEARGVAYGTLLQCYAGFAGLNRHPDVPPRVGFAWLDPMCGLMLAFVAAAALWQRRHGGCGRARRFLDDRGDAVDDGRAAAGDATSRAAASRSATRPARYAPHGVLSLRRRRRVDQRRGHQRRRNGGRCARWCRRWRHTRGWRCPRAHGSSRARSMRRSAAWLRPQRAPDAAAALVRAGIPAAALATSRDLVESAHLRAPGVLGTAWRGRAAGPAVAGEFRPAIRCRRRSLGRIPTAC